MFDPLTANFNEYLFLSLSLFCPRALPTISVLEAGRPCGLHTALSRAVAGIDKLSWNRSLQGLTHCLYGKFQVADTSSAGWLPAPIKVRGAFA